MKYTIFIILFLGFSILLFRSGYEMGYTDMYIEHVEQHIEEETAVDALLKVLTEYEKGQ